MPFKLLAQQESRMGVNDASLGIIGSSRATDLFENTTKSI
jgi:hypothetical protein